MSLNNLVEMLGQSARGAPDHVAQRYWDGQQWIDRSYRALWEMVQSTARGLKQLGIQPGERVGLLSSTRSEWVIADYAILTLDGVTVPIYPSVPRDNIEHIVEDAGLRWVIVENATLAEKLPNTVEAILLQGKKPGAIAFSSLQLPGADLAPSAGRQDLATLVYTSGTTGLAKGAMLTHGNLLSNVEAISQVVNEREETQVTPDDVALSFLPLSHILERTVHNVFFYEGITIAYARSTDTLSEDLNLCHPTIMVLVPRVLEKIYARVQATVDGLSPMEQQVFDQALTAGLDRYEKELGGLAASDDPSWPIYEQFVFQRVRDSLGGRIRYVISGGAALSPDVGRYFFALGIPVLEGYGLTETAPVLAVNRMPLPRFGWAGKILPGVEMRVADDGELLARGPNIFLGYWNLPEESEESLADGWFHTGDIGQISDDGYVKITDRKKSIIVLSTGKNVAPLAIETRLATSPFIDQSVAIGNGKKYVSLLLYLDPGVVMRWAQQEGKKDASYTDLLADPDLLQGIGAEIERLCADLAPFERPKKFRLLSHPLSEQGGELTPSLKVKFSFVQKKYHVLIDEMYQETLG